MRRGSLGIVVSVALACVLVAPPALCAASTSRWRSVTVAGEGGGQLFPGRHSVSITGGLEHIDVVARGKADWYLFEFEPPSGKELEVGEYTGAERYRPGGYPGLTVARDGDLCSNDYGRFIIKAIHVDKAGKVDRLWALYEQHCSTPTAPPVFGEVRVDEPVPSVPATVLPRAVTWPTIHPGVTGQQVPVTVTAGASATRVASLQIEGPDAGDFSMASDACMHKRLRAHASCKLMLTATPSAVGVHTAQLVVDYSPRGRSTVELQAAAEPLLAINAATLVSENGDSVGGGIDRVFDQEGSLVLTGGTGEVEVLAATESEWFDFQFAAPGGKSLEIGEYPEAHRPFLWRENSPGLDIGGDGRGCNQTIGRFTIKDIHFDASGHVDRFWAIYEQHCGEPEALEEYVEPPELPALFGEVRVGEPPTTTPEAVIPASIEWPHTVLGKSGVAVPVTVIGGESGADIAEIDLAGPNTGDFSIASNNCEGVYLLSGMSCEVMVGVKPTEAGTRTATLDVTDASHSTTAVPLSVLAEAPQPPKAADATLVSESGDFVGAGRDVTFDSPSAFRIRGTKRYVEIDAEEGEHRFSFDFSAPSGQVLEVGEYSGTERFSGEHSPGLDVSGDGRGCDRDYGRFIVKDIAVSARGHVNRFWALYEQHCESPESPALFGEVRVGEPGAGLESAPAAIEWPHTAVGTTGVEVPVKIVAGASGAEIANVSLEGADPGDFRIESDNCEGATLLPGAICELAVAVRPTETGARTAEMLVRERSGTKTAIPLAVPAETF